MAIFYYFFFEKTLLEFRKILNLKYDIAWNIDFAVLNIYNNIVYPGWVFDFTIYGIISNISNNYFNEY